MDIKKRLNRQIQAGVVAGDNHPLLSLCQDVLTEIERLEKIVQDVDRIAATDYGPAAAARIAERLRTRRV